MQDIDLIRPVTSDKQHARTRPNVSAENQRKKTEIIGEALGQTHDNMNRTTID
jgi:hypothetical protein